ncbi:hypothetical protein [Pseudoalteromonas rubra]|uniref:Uncharacterized protein n=1 Tax=Pseudoalteromonas rubra TaxID=43658 RepID=A0A4Q7EKB6_9GAMM|nr:hypothetical protein [Pseudoalteromonas rubra]RZM84327.1 hypothetical protein C3B51_04245 [Pseudoalteromonas rubra]
MDKTLIVIAMLSGIASLSVNAEQHPLKFASDQYVSETVSWIENEGVRCGADAFHPLCDTVTVKFSDGAFERERTDPRQTVLVLDSGMNLHSVLRYRSRIKAHLVYDPQSNTFVESDPEVAISRLGQKLLSELDTFVDPNTQQPAFLPSAWLRDLALAYGSAAPGDMQDHHTQVSHFSHGSKVLGYLTQHNPDAEFVLIDTASFLPFLQHKEAICAQDSATLNEYMKVAAGSLKQDVIDRYEVEYVNYSGGFTRSHVHQAWSNNECEGSLSNAQAKSLLNTLDPVYQQLFDSPNVLGIQSGKRNATNGEDALDVKGYANRIRVQPYTTEAVNTDIARTGETGWQAVYADFKAEFAGHTHIDMYVNFGYGRVNYFNQNSTPKMTSDVFGMQYAADWALLASSWAAPVATSLAIDTQTKLYNETRQVAFDPGLLKSHLLPKSCDRVAGYWWVSGIYDFMRAGDNTCRIQDPLKYRADQLNSQGYLGN